MKIHFIFILLFASPFLSCAPVHTATTEVGDHLYLEYFNINPFGVEEVYLTDSTNFRVSIGKYDTDHERIGCRVNGDTLIVTKTFEVERGVRKIIDQAQLSREYLTKNKVDSTKPLFIFR